MDSYLMMLYVTLEQESALKTFFQSQGWHFSKPDLSVITDKLGPSTGFQPATEQQLANQKHILQETQTSKRFAKRRKLTGSPPGRSLLPARTTRSSPASSSIPPALGTLSGLDTSRLVENSAVEPAVHKQLPLVSVTDTTGVSQQPSVSSIVLPDGKQVTVKLETNHSDDDDVAEDSLGNYPDDSVGVGSFVNSELKQEDSNSADGNNDANDDEDTDVDYNMEGFEEGEIKLETRNIAGAGGDNSAVTDTSMDNITDSQSRDQPQSGKKDTEVKGPKAKKSRAQIQKEYRERKKAREGNAYLEKERRRQHRYKKKASQMTPEELRRKRAMNKQHMDKYRRKLKQLKFIFSSNETPWQ